MRKIKFYALLCLSVVFATTSCKHKSDRPPYQLDNNSKPYISIPYEEMGGVKVIPVKLNGVTMNMVYDTGCSGIHLSLNELQTLYKNGKFGQDDVLGVEYTAIADGSIVENGSINIKEIKIGEGDASIVIHNKTATVALNQVAPILLGNEVLDELASVEVDNVNKKINFYKK